MLLLWLVETLLLCWKMAIEEARMFTLDGIDTQFNSKWTSLDILKEGLVVSYFLIASRL